MINQHLKSWLPDAAARLGFDLWGISPVDLDERHRNQYLRWLEQGFHGEMGYMKRFERQDIRSLMPNVRSVICVGMNYHTSYSLSTECNDPARGWIARYAWGDDYHEVLRQRLECLVRELRGVAGDGLETKIYVDTGPLLERAVAWRAGLGWIAKNTCLINETMGSWFLLGEVLTNLDLEPDVPPPERCGTCTRCIEACPTTAITEPYLLDATRCISYYTIETKGAIPDPMRHELDRHVFGCDICQDVCPWNSRAPRTSLPDFQPRQLPLPPDEPLSAFNPPLEKLAELTETQFEQMFRGSPVRRPKYRGFLRNVAIAMGNSREAKFRPVLERLGCHSDPLVRHHAMWALEQLKAASATGA